jgi:Fuc2NAc and GlcNAc transferase
MNIFSLLIFFSLSFFGTLFYRKIAINKNFLANPNYRSLHINPIPVGGGIVFSMIFIIGILSLWYLNHSSNTIILLLACGGTIAALVGYYDDLKDISALKKLILQVLLALWVLYWIDGGPLVLLEWIPSSLTIPLTLFFLVWIMNAYNFMDGIDGMAISGSVFASGMILWILILTRPESEFILVMGLLLVSSGAFMFFNWPPASIFMGDAGSSFLGYIFGSIILLTVMTDDLSIWTWLVVFSYFFADIMVTQFMRLILVKKWYQAHRSHAYQNLARIKDSHFKVTGSVALYNLIWVLPLSLWSALSPGMAFYAVLLSVTPGLVVAFRFGPRLSSS